MNLTIDILIVSLIKSLLGLHPTLFRNDTQPILLYWKAKKTFMNIYSEVIEDSPWDPSIALTQEKYGNIRFCVDYRRLNAATTQFLTQK